MRSGWKIMNQSQALLNKSLFWTINSKKKGEKSSPPEWILHFILINSFIWKKTFTMKQLKEKKMYIYKTFTASILGHTNVTQPVCVCVCGPTWLAPSGRRVSCSHSRLPSQLLLQRTEQLLLVWPQNSERARKMRSGLTGSQNAAWAEREEQRQRACRLH